MRRVGLLAVSACNWAFGVHDTKPEPHDAQIDAPFTCLASGPPTFTHVLHQVLDVGCWSFTMSGSLAAAGCYGSDVGSPSDQVVYVGPLGSSEGWSVVAGVNGNYVDVLLVPDGDEIWTFYFDYSSNTSRFVVLGRDAGWQPVATPTLPFPYLDGDYPSLPTQRPDRRMLYFRYADATWHELHETAPGTWTDERMHPELGGYMYNPRLSADGLRLTGWEYVGMSSNQTTVYTSRTNPAGGDFAAVAPMPSVPMTAQYPTLTEDCGRVYLSGLSSVFYAQQP
jgi:hypothetical protein